MHMGCEYGVGSASTSSNSTTLMRLRIAGIAVRIEPVEISIPVSVGQNTGGARTCTEVGWVLVCQLFNLAFIVANCTAHELPLSADSSSSHISSSSSSSTSIELFSSKW